MNRPTKLALAVAVALGVAACGKEEPKPAPKAEEDRRSPMQKLLDRFR